MSAWSLCTWGTILSLYIPGQFCSSEEYFSEDYNTHFGLRGINQTVQPDDNCGSQVCAVDL